MPVLAATELQAQLHQAEDARQHRLIDIDRLYPVEARGAALPEDHAGVQPELLGSDPEAGTQPPQHAEQRRTGRDQRPHPSAAAQRPPAEHRDDEP